MNTSKSKNIVVVLLILAVGGLGFISWNQYRELLGLRNSSISDKDLAALRQQLLDAESRARQLQAQLAAAGNGTADDAAAADAADAAAADNAGPGGRAGRGGFGGRGGAAQNAELQALLQTPEAIRLSLTQQKAQYSIQYAALFRSLGLPADMVDQLTSLMADRANIQQDLQAAALAAGINPQDDPAAFRELVASEQGAVDTQIQALLGADAYAEYQQFQNTMNRRTEVASFQEIMTTAGVPMDASQVEALVAALASYDTGDTATGGGGRGGFGGGRGGGGINVQNVSERNMTAASTVLNPTQLSVLQAVRDEQQASSQLQQMTSSVTGGGRGGRGGFGGGGGGPGGGGPGGGGGGN